MTMFQDNLFSSARMIERTLPSGTVLRLLLEPLPGERIRVLEYHRRAPGERWQRLHEEEGRTLRVEQLKLKCSFFEVFAAHKLREVRELHAI